MNAPEAPCRAPSAPSSACLPSTGKKHSLKPVNNACALSSSFCSSAILSLPTLSRPTCHSFFTGPVFLVGRASSPAIPARMIGENSLFRTVLR